MNWKGALRVIWRTVKPVASDAIQWGAAASGVPLAGTILNAIIFAQDRADDGPARMTAALDSLSVAAPLIIDQLERQLGVDIPEDAAAAYVRAQVQAHVDLMNACRLLPRKGA